MKEIISLSNCSKTTIELIKKLADQISCEKSYPASIINRTQKGKIFIDDPQKPKAAIFWHYCGIAYITGCSDNSEFKKTLLLLLNEQYESNQRRFYLIVSKNNTDWISFLDTYSKQNSHIIKSERYSFNLDLNKYKSTNFILPENFKYFEIQQKHFLSLTGRVIPAFSWDSFESFSAYGKGFGIYDTINNQIVSTSFSSAIGNGYIDIGIETQPKYRNKGFATLAAAKMVEYALLHNQIPEWGCDACNIGSAATAKSIGFTLSDVYYVYTKHS